MYSLVRGVWRPPPQKKALDNRHRVEMRVHSPIFNGQVKEKNKTDNFNSFGAKKGGKNA